ncbi:MAG TPA: YfhO family protein [Bacteroidota bacterium]|nr:YfhO family protein [Bacteroidota bacterium]
MTQPRKDRRHRAPEAGTPFSTLAPWVQDLLCVGFLYAVTLVLFRGIVFDNAAFASAGDTAASMSYTHAGQELTRTEGVDVVWMPYFFSGMPTFGCVAYVPHNVSYVQTILQALLNLLYLNGTWTWLIVYDFLGGVSMFFLMRRWNYGRAAALVAALTFMLSPYMVGLAGEGHGSKLMALCYLPLVVLLTDLLLERRDLLGLGLLGAAIGTLMLTDHMQIVYYVFIFIALFLLFHVVTDIRTRPALALGKAALFGAALLLGMCIASYIYLSVYEYAQYSMRGGGTTGAAGGLAYDYATNWSWHPGELLTLLIPGFYGMKVEYYWGPMIPWTNSSVYVGLAPLLFGAVALTVRRTPRVIFFGLTALIVVLLSFGNNFSLLYQPLFDYLPFFNKFRSPEQILHMLPFLTGVLGAAGFTAVIALRDEDSSGRARALQRALLVAGGAIGGVLLVALLIQGSLLESLPASMFLKEGQAEMLQRQYGARAPRVIAQLREARFDIFWKDFVKFALLAVAFCGAVVAWLRGRIREWTFGTVVVVLVTIDLALVAGKYIDPKPRQDLEQAFPPDPTIRFLQSQGGLFRIFAGVDPSDPLYMDNGFAYHGLQSVTGYSPAKLKIYQTMLDSCMYRRPDPSFPINMHIVDMLNVEYLVLHARLPEPMFQLVNVDQATRTLTYRNPGALPRAFFVSDVAVAPTDADQFRVLNSPGFDPARTAVLYRPPAAPIAPVDSAHAPRITTYRSREIRIATDAPGAALLVLSEVYYPAGWKAFVDGVETPIERTDYMLRSVLVPGGTHEVVFTFDPPLYRTGWVLSNAAWGVVVLCVAAGLWRHGALRRRLAGAQDAQRG